MKNVKIYYLLNQEGRKQDIKNGGEGTMLQCIETPVTEEILQLKSCNVSKNGEIVLPIGLSENAINYLFKGKIIDSRDGVVVSKEVKDSYYSEPSISNIYNLIYFSKLMFAKDLVEFEKTRLKKINLLENSLQKELEIKLDIYKKKKEEEKEKEKEKEKKEKERREKYKKEEEEKEKQKAIQLEQKANWINQHGSEYLKKAFSLGYDCQRKYVTEYRDSITKLKDFVIDFNDTLEYSSRTMPSLEALDLQISLQKAGFNALVVWATSPATETIYEDENDLHKIIYDFEEREAIVIKDFLGRYFLYKEI